MSDRPGTRTQLDDRAAGGSPVLAGWSLLVPCDKHMYGPVRLNHVTCSVCPHHRWEALGVVPRAGEKGENAYNSGPMV